MSSENKTPTSETTNLAKTASVDKIVKQSMEMLDKFPPPIYGWNKTVTWEVIKNKLVDADKKILVWGMVMAASISLVVAAGINYIGFLTPKIPNSELSGNVELESKVVHPTRPSKNLTRPGLLNEVSKKIGVDNPTSGPNTINIHSKNDISPLEDKMLQPAFSEYSSKPTITPYLLINQNVSSVVPGVGLGFELNLFQKQKGNFHEGWKLGLNSTLRQVQSESELKLTPVTYLNVGFERINTVKDTGWSASAGLMLHNDTNLYKNTTVRFSLNRQFSKRIKLGPEVIFTENFTKAYPGVTLILS